MSIVRVFQQVATAAIALAACSDMITYTDAAPVAGDSPAAAAAPTTVSMSPTALARTLAMWEDPAQRSQGAGDVKRVVESADIWLQRAKK